MVLWFRGIGPLRFKCGFDISREVEREMSDADTKRPIKDRRLLRLTVIGCTFGLIMCYAALIPLKMFDGLPARITWTMVGVWPVLAYGWLGGTVVTTILYPHRQFTWFLGLTSAFLAIMLLVAFFRL